MSLGGSHTQGYEVPQDFTYSAVMERYLNARGYEAELHRPNGHRHISEFSHIFLGVNGAGQIASWLGVIESGTDST